MSDNNIVQKDGRYLCNSCLKMSNNAEYCSFCGAEIGEFDLNNAVFMPPRTIKCVIGLGDYSEVSVRSAISSVSEKYFDTFEIQVNEFQIEIITNDIAFDRLVLALGNVCGSTNSEVLQKIIIKDA